MTVNIDKEYIMNSMLESLKGHIKFYRDTTTKDLANIYLGELSGFEIFFNEVAARGEFVDETREINNEFRKELEVARQILSKKFESGELR